MVKSGLKINKSH